MQQANDDDECGGITQEFLESMRRSFNSMVWAARQADSRQLRSTAIGEALLTVAAVKYVLHKKHPDATQAALGGLEFIIQATRDLAELTDFIMNQEMEDIGTGEAPLPATEDWREEISKMLKNRFKPSDN